MPEIDIVHIIWKKRGKKSRPSTHFLGKDKQNSYISIDIGVKKRKLANFEK